jgi:hypothetical protein
MIKRTLSRQEQIARATDPIFALIAEETRLRNLGVDFRRRADMGWFAIDKAERTRLSDVDEPDRPEPCGRLYAEARRYEDAAGDIYDRIAATRAKTLAGIVAKLEYAGNSESQLINSAIKDLQKLAAKGGEAQP